MHPTHHRLTLLLCASFLVVSSVLALPQFAARTGERCQSCHVDPSGMGMRTLNGASYGRDDLPVNAWKDTNALDEFSTNLTKNINIGTDVRTLYYYTEGNKKGSFFEMEGNIYLDFRLNKKIRVYASKGLYTGFQVFGLARVLPLDGYVKVGKFIPAYGLRIDDHNAFIRGGSYVGAFAPVLPPGDPAGLRFGERSEDNGIELGIAPSIFNLSAGVFDGTPGGGLTGTNGTKTYAFVARGEAIIPTDVVNISIGGSFYNYPNPTIPGKTQFYGAFGSLGIMKNLTLLGETDWAIHNILGKDITARMLYTQLYYTLTSGLDVFAGYEFYDPDINLSNGTASTVTVGTSFFPLSGVEARPQYRINTESPVEIKNNEFDIIFHFYM